MGAGVSGVLPPTANRLSKTCRGLRWEPLPACHCPIRISLGGDRVTLLHVERRILSLPRRKFPGFRSERSGVTNRCTERVHPQCISQHLRFVSPAGSARLPEWSGVATHRGYGRRLPSGTLTVLSQARDDCAHQITVDRLTAYDSESHCALSRGSISSSLTSTIYSPMRATSRSSFLRFASKWRL